MSNPELDEEESKEEIEEVSDSEIEIDNKVRCALGLSS